MVMRNCVLFTLTLLNRTSKTVVAVSVHRILYNIQHSLEFAKLGWSFIPTEMLTRFFFFYIVYASCLYRNIARILMIPDLIWAQTLFGKVWAQFKSGIINIYNLYYGIKSGIMNIYNLYIWF